METQDDFAVKVLLCWTDEFSFILDFLRL